MSNNDASLSAPTPAAGLMGIIRTREVYVRLTRLGRAVFANRPLQQGERVLHTTGHKAVKQSMYTIQIGINQHFDPAPPVRYLNHSCEPNLGVRTNAEGLPDFYALRDIAYGEELTFDYAMTEYDIVMADVRCQCGADRCRGRLGRYQDLPDDIKAEYGDYVSDYLLYMG